MSEKNLIIEQMELGPMENFLYFIGDKSTRQIAVVDPAWDVDFLRKKADEQKYAISCILLTHGHSDHVNGLDALLKTHDIPVYISADEANFYTPDCKNLHKLQDGDTVQIGGLELQCLLTPGHTPGCLCYRYQNTVITGDTLFIDGCGRCDLPGGNAEQMYHSLHDVIMNLPDTSVFYPGHNYGPTPTDTLANQKKTNPYLACGSKEEFLHQRMGLAF